MQGSSYSRMCFVDVGYDPLDNHAFFFFFYQTRSSRPYGWLVEKAVTVMLIPMMGIKTIYYFLLGFYFARRLIRMDHMYHNLHRSLLVLRVY